MFNLFRKKKKIPLGFQQHPNIVKFNEITTEEQKAAIFYTLLIVMGTEGVINHKMYDYIESQAKALNFSLNSQSMQKYKSEDTKYAYEVLKKLSTDQKTWFATALYSMLYDIGEKPTENQIGLYLRIGEKTSNAFMR